jgi:hypothetical protein
MMKKTGLAALLALLLSVTSHATTWIGTISDSHCAANFTAIPGDDSACIVFIANDQQVYKVPDQERIKPFVGKEVTIVGTLSPELTIGVSYETQGIVTIEDIHPIAPLEIQPHDAGVYQGWMKALQPQMSATRKAIGAKDNARVAAEAGKLVALLDQVATFWRSHERADAVQFAADGIEAAKAVGRAQTLFDQTVALQKVQNACAGCHLAHRSGKPGHFRMIK